MADIPSNIDLLSAATATLDNSYSPYSNFAVACSIASSTGTLYSGCNVENAAYSLSLCAEANAIGQMISQGEREITAILVLVKGDHRISPCGGCRQQLAEFATADTPVYLCNTAGEERRFNLGELIPECFTLATGDHND